jgi:hypothetical protein
MPPTQCDVDPLRDLLEVGRRLVREDVAGDDDDRDRSEGQRSPQRRPPSPSLPQPERDERQEGEERRVDVPKCLDRTRHSATRLPIAV